MSYEKLSRLPIKREPAESHIHPILTALNVMKLAISIAIMVLFIGLAGKPHPKPDPLAEAHLPGITVTAYAQALPKPQTVKQAAPAVKPPETAPAQPTQPATPAFDVNNPATWPKCGDNQQVWAQDGQCHDKPAQAAAQAAPVAYSAPVNGATAGCGDNADANFIYRHESGCRTNAVNSIGACGLGQALPCGKMGCDLSDYACQNNWFTGYMQSRYGSWAAARAYWMSHGYACNNDVGWCGNW